MRWLHRRGIDMACAHQISEVLPGLQAAWQPYAASGEPVNALQKLSYGLSALGNLRTQHAGEKMLEVYRASGISAAAAGRLSTSAVRQLESLAALALAAAAELGNGMLNELVNACLALTGLDCRIDAGMLKARLVRKGYCGPLAEAIALAWQEALAQLQDRPIGKNDAQTLGQLMDFLGHQTGSHASALFASAMLAKLGSRERLTSLRAMLGAGDDEGAHALFQVQCDQLRQYCAQLAAQEESKAPGASGD